MAEWTNNEVNEELSRILKSYEDGDDEVLSRPSSCAVRRRDSVKKNDTSTNNDDKKNVDREKLRDARKKLESLLDEVNVRLRVGYDKIYKDYKGDLLLLDPEKPDKDKKRAREKPWYHYRILLGSFLSDENVDWAENVLERNCCIDTTRYDMKSRSNTFRLQMKIFDILKSHLISYAASVLVVLVPLYISTVYNLSSPVPYDINTCNQIKPGTWNSSASRFSARRKDFSHGADCMQAIPVTQVSAIAISLNNEPYYPLSFATNSTTGYSCQGFATTYANHGDEDWAPWLQFSVYVVQAVYYVVIFLREVSQVQAIKLAFRLKGVLRDDDDDKYTIYLPRSGDKVTFPKGVIDFMTVFGLLSFYFLTLVGDIATTEYWIVFPYATASTADLAHRLTYFGQRGQFHTQRTHVVYCDAVATPSVIEYSNGGRVQPVSAMFQAVLFAYSIYNFVKNQQKLYDWVDSDKLMLALQDDGKICDVAELQHLNATKSEDANDEEQQVDNQSENSVEGDRAEESYMYTCLTTYRQNPYSRDELTDYMTLYCDFPVFVKLLKNHSQWIKQELLVAPATTTTAATTAAAADGGDNHAAVQAPLSTSEVRIETAVGGGGGGVPASVAPSSLSPAAAEKKRRGAGAGSSETKAHDAAAARRCSSLCCSCSREEWWMKLLLVVVLFILGVPIITVAALGSITYFAYWIVYQFLWRRLICEHAYAALGLDTEEKKAKRLQALCDFLCAQDDGHKSFCNFCFHPSVSHHEKPFTLHLPGGGTREVKLDTRKKRLVAALHEIHYRRLQLAAEDRTKGRRASLDVARVPFGPIKQQGGQSRTTMNLSSSSSSSGVFVGVRGIGNSSSSRDTFDFCSLRSTSIGLEDEVAAARGGSYAHQQ